MQPSRPLSVPQASSTGNPCEFCGRAFHGSRLIVGRLAVGGPGAPVRRRSRLTTAIVVTHEPRPVAHGDMRFNPGLLMRCRMGAKKLLGMAPSAIYTMTQRPRHTILTPILRNSSRSVVGRCWATCVARANVASWLRTRLQGPGGARPNRAP